MLITDGVRTLEHPLEFERCRQTPHRIPPDTALLRRLGMPDWCMTYCTMQSNTAVCLADVDGCKAIHKRTVNQKKQVHIEVITKGFNKCSSVLRLVMRDLP